MIDLAIQQGCPIIVKNEKNGKWYIKGNDFLHLFSFTVHRLNYEKNNKKRINID